MLMDGFPSPGDSVHKLWVLPSGSLLHAQVKRGNESDLISTGQRVTEYVTIDSQSLCQITRSEPRSSPLEQDLLTHTYHPCSWKAEAGGWQVQG
jgi:hypothetical protein